MCLIIYSMYSFRVSADLCFPLQMEVNVVKKRHRTRSKGVRGTSLSAFVLSYYSLVQDF